MKNYKSCQLEKLLTFPTFEEIFQLLLNYALSVFVFVVLCAPTWKFYYHPYTSWQMTHVNSVVISGASSPKISIFLFKLHLSIYLFIYLFIYL